MDMLFKPGTYSILVQKTHFGKERKGREEALMALGIGFALDCIRKERRALQLARLVIKTKRK